MFDGDRVVGTNPLENPLLSASGWQGSAKLDSVTV